jgi:hypothetical protein
MKPIARVLSRIAGCLLRSSAVVVCCIVVLAVALRFLGPGRRGDSPHRVYVMLGFHSNFYHSWRGDTPDEAGFGTDIRLVRHILSELDRANSEGLDARAYWDHDNLFTLETIIPEHAPDILEAIRRRVSRGLDEVALGAYSNGLTGAMTERELRATIEWAAGNPWGSGVNDLFGSCAPVFRAQEGMLTTGSIPLLAESGVEAVVLAYSEWPFNAFSNFVPVLAPEQRYGVTWLRLRENGPRIRLLPAMSIGDVLNHISFERWLLDLRELQLRGVVDQDLVLHMNFDADVESWLPHEMPPGLGWFPNSGGLREYIEAVDAYPWAEFATPSEILAGLEPVGEVIVRQDTADGAFDGHASWAEKFPSHSTWTDLEASRLAGRRAEAWLKEVEPDGPQDVLREAVSVLWEGRESVFFTRLRGLSTTHFGMSTPVLNEERQAVATRVAREARGRAEAVERRTAEVAAERRLGRLQEDTLARLLIRDLRGDGSQGAAHSVVRVPFVFDGELPPTRLIDDGGGEPTNAWLNVEPVDGATAAELWVFLELEPGENRVLELQRVGGMAAPKVASEKSALDGEDLRLEIDGGWIASLHTGEWQVGGEELVEPFVTYLVGEGDRAERRRFAATGGARASLELERPGDLQRARLGLSIPMMTPAGERAVRVDVDLTLHPTAPWLIADLDVAYPATTTRDLLHTTQQKLRRYLDLRWIEVAPFPLTPRLMGTRENPLVVWKHNHLGVVSSFELNYGEINPRNAELDAFNHQITAGWVALSDGERGLVLGTDADVRSSFAFAPMRLREINGQQVVTVNPFGTFHGRQLAYDHLGGNGVGTALTTLGSSALRPNGPSYNGQRERISLLIAPYLGDQPPQLLQNDAAVFFHSPAVVVRTTEGIRLPVDLRREIDARRVAEARRIEGPLPVPIAFLANPTVGAVDLVWEPARDPRVDGYEIWWRPVVRGGWKEVRVGRVDRHRVAGLNNGRPLEFRLRSVGGGAVSDWTETLQAQAGPVAVVDPRKTVDDAPLALLAKTFWYGLVHLLTTI